MIGAGIFALTGQLAEQACGLFPFAYLAAAVVAGFSANSYVKVRSDSPSAGGIAMILKRCYGQGVVTASMALLMYFLMVVNEALVARTVGTYVMQLFEGKDAGQAEGSAWLVPAPGVGLVVSSFLPNLAEMPRSAASRRSPRG